MKEFFLFLKSLIDANGTFGNVMLFNEQPDKTRKGEYKATKKRSVYIELIVNETMNKSLGINDFEMNVRFTIANDNKKFSKLEDITLIETLNGVIQNANNQVDDVYAFSSMNRMFHELDTDHDQISEPFIEYQTKLTDYSGYRRRNLTEGAFTKVDVTVTAPNDGVRVLFPQLAAPTALILTVIDEESIQLDWTSNSAGEEVGFGIERGLDGFTFVQVATVLSGIVTFTDTGLDESTTYFYKVRALSEL